MPNVAFVREELKKLLEQYELIEDCIAGEKRVKYRRQKYLMQPNASDGSRENLERYNAYLGRAVFYNVTQRTLLGLVGQIFSKDPVIEVPSLLDTVKIDATGGGITITQVAKRAVALTLALGRCGIFVDYPASDVPASKLELEEGDIRPTINVYDPKNVVNWRTKVRGAKEILSLVVLKERKIFEDDGFETKMCDQWRVLSLDANDIYNVQVFRTVEATNNYAAVESYTPKDGKGQPLNEIPFTFVGSENNDDMPDLPPLYDLASLNVAHYRNSADYEEACFLVGQPTPYFCGLTQDWVENVLKGSIALGARGAVALPQGATAGLLQAEPNTMVKEAMEQKEAQMLALGAKLVESSVGTGDKTATQSTIEDASETSALVSSAKNVSAAMQFALEWCAVFVGVAEAQVQFELQTDFAIARMGATERAELVKEWQANAITFSELRAVLRKTGIATLDDDAAKTEIEQENQLAMQNAIDQAGGIAVATNPDATPPDDNTKQPADATPGAKTKPGQNNNK